MPDGLPRMSQRGLFAARVSSIPVCPMRGAGGGRMQRGAYAAAIALGVCLGLTACAGSTTPLPDLRRASPSLSQQEQREAMEALSRKGSNHADNAVRAIEGQQ